MVSVDISSMSVQPAVTMPRENLWLIEAKQGLCLTLPAERESDRARLGAWVCVLGAVRVLGGGEGVICWGQGEWMALKRHKPQPAHLPPPPRTLLWGVCERVKISSANQEKINRAVPLGIVGTGEGFRPSQAESMCHTCWMVHMATYHITLSAHLFINSLTWIVSRDA